MIARKGAGGVNFATIVPEVSPDAVGEIAPPVGLLTFTMDKVDDDHWMRRSTSAAAVAAGVPLLTGAVVQACDLIGITACGSASVLNIPDTPLGPLHLRGNLPSIQHVYYLRRVVGADEQPLTGAPFRDPVRDFPPEMMAGTTQTPPADCAAGVSEWECYTHTVARTALLANTDPHHPCGSPAASYLGAVRNGGDDGARARGPAVAAALAAAAAALCGGAAVWATLRRLRGGAAAPLAEALAPDDEVAKCAVDV